VTMRALLGPAKCCGPKIKPPASINERRRLLD
jgi:hypothetical protein